MAGDSTGHLFHSPIGESGVSSDGFSAVLGSH